MCNSKRPKESGKLKSRLVRSRNTGENRLRERERKVLRRKHVEAEGQTYEPGTFWPQFLWVTGVFLNLKLCAFWRSAAHSVHNNVLTIHSGPIKVYIFEVCEVIASAWIKWFSRTLSFSTTYPSQEKVHKCFVSASGGGGGGGVTGHFSDLFHKQFKSETFMHLSCSLLISGIHFDSHSLRKLGCHKFCLSIASIGWLSTGLNHTFLATSALKQYFHRKKMSQCTLCENMKAFLPELHEI